MVCDGVLVVWGNDWARDDARVCGARNFILWLCGLGLVSRMCWKKRFCAAKEWDLCGRSLWDHNILAEPLVKGRTDDKEIIKKEKKKKFPYK
jgi:hypothetical protein